MLFSLGAPLLDACVLAVLSRGDAYGYSLTQQVKEVMDISESTLYPVLRRLQRDGCLRVYDQAWQGRNRRYYALTDTGRRQLTEYRRAWLDYRSRVEHLLLSEGQGGMEHE